MSLGSNGGEIDKVMAGIMIGDFSSSQINELLKLLRYEI